MIVLILGVSIFLHISNAYVVNPYNEQEEPKSITMFINGQDNPDGRRRASHKKHHKRTSEDVLEDLYNNAPESGTKHQTGDKSRSKHNNQQYRPNDMDLTKLFNSIINYLRSTGLINGARSSTGNKAETKIDLVKLVNAAFTYLSSLNQKYPTNSMRSLEPRPIELRSKDETSLLYEINAKKIVQDVSNLLSSNNMQRFIDTFARKAASIYHAVTKDDHEDN